MVTGEETADSERRADYGADAEPDPTAHSLARLSILTHATVLPSLSMSLTSPSGISGSAYRGSPANWPTYVSKVVSFWMRTFSGAG